MTTHSLHAFFQPRGIVIVGASSKPEKLGYGVVRNLLRSGYAGAIHFVNPKGGEILSRPVYRALSEVPDPVDLAVLVVPAPAAPETLRACGERGIHAVILVSGGFRETGEEGASLEAACVDIAKEYDIRMIGPNCIGILDTHLPLDTTFLPPPPPESGELAFVSHSGAICAAIVDWSLREGFGFSRLLSLGNQADVTETDVLPFVAEDEHTRVITMYLESIRDGRAFIETAQRITREKAILALKVGRSESGQRAASSHTGAMAGAETAYDAAFAKCGIFRADTVEEMFDWARALAWSKPLSGNRIAILTNAGGPGVIAADALDFNGLSLAPLSSQTREALRAILPPAASLHNPVDMLASASARDYAESLRILLEDESVDGVLVILPPPPMYPAEDAADLLIPVIRASEKPVLLALMGGAQIAEAASRFRAAKITDYPFPERAASAFGKLHERAVFLRSQEKAEEMPRINLDAARAALTHARPGEWLDADSADALMRAAGIETAPMRLARSAEEAESIAAAIGFPLVLKIASPDIPHKSDVDGILLNVRSAAEAADGFARLTARVQSRCPSARLEGVHLQRMIPSGQEVILGAVQDPQFGALMMFGSGGIEAEGMKDVAFALAPLTKREARAMLEKTWAGRKLQGFRNLPPADEDAVIHALQRLAALADALPEIAEMEINPLRVLESGAVAVDIRVKIRSQETA
jgi:acetyltransferase